MSRYEPYSLRRRQAERTEKPATFLYEPITKEFKVQAIYALKRALGQRADPDGELWCALERWIREEHGLFFLPPLHANCEFKITKYVDEMQLSDRVLDVIEFGFRIAQVVVAPEGPDDSSDDEDVGRVRAEISLLNSRFHQHDLGYQFVGWPGLVIREDSQYVHAEVVEPAIAFLHAAGFRGPLDEFMKAHREYRKGDNKDAMNDALKSFESTMKAICDARSWQYDRNATATPLIRAMIDNGLIPPSLHSYLGGVRSILESSVPTLRNKESGHGQGSSVTSVPDYMVAFTLNLTAANIVFLMSAFDALP